MIRFVIRLFVIAAVLFYVIPELAPGLHVIGPFWPKAVVASFIFSLAMVVVAILAVFFTFFTMGIGIIVFWLGSWLLYACALQLTNLWVPELLAVDSWTSALIGGAVLMVTYWLLKAFLDKK